MVVEPVTVNLVAAGLAKGAATGREKIKKVLRRQKFDSEVNELCTEFNDILRDELVTDLQTLQDDITKAEIKKNWDVVARELDEIQVVFDSQTEGIHIIASAVAKGLNDGVGASNVDVEDIEPLVADVYRQVLSKFKQRVSGTELADTLSHEAEIELSRSIRVVEESLQEYSERLDETRQAELKNQGFVRISDSYFENHSPAPPSRCWRTEFELSEVNAGYAVSREKVDSNGNRCYISKTLIDTLEEGTDCVLLGPPGSGKSTICKEVACQWYNDRRGDVLYRASDQSLTLSDRGVLGEQISRSEELTLVMVEDAIREETRDIFRLIRDLQNEGSAVFLLDSRDSEWHGADTMLPDARLQEIKNRHLEHHTLPRIDRRECKRIIEHFETTTDSTVPDSPDEIYEAIRSDSGVGEMLQLSYHLSFYIRELDSPERLDPGVTSLEQTVRNVIDDQVNAEDELFSLQFGVLLNLLNAADIGVRPELLHALAEDESGHRQIDTLLEAYEGVLVFSEEDKVITDQTTPLRTNHEFWSTLYLQELLEVLGHRRATRIFEDCLKKLFDVFDNRDKRQDINYWYHQEMEFFKQIERQPTATADGTVDSLFKLGRRHSGLSTLYGRTKYNKAELPDACTPSMIPRTALWRGIMYFHNGDFEIAKEEFGEASKSLEAVNDIQPMEVKKIDGWCENYIGAIERERGNLKEARNRIEQSSQQFKQVKERSGMASNQYNLGRLFWVKSDFKRALEYLEDALDDFREIDDSRNISVTLNSIGLVYRDLSEFDKAEKRLKLSQKNAREAGDERSEARALNHLGEVERYQSNYSDAEAYYRQGLKIARKVGDKHCEAWLVHNLGTIAKKHGRLDDALKRFKKSREIKQGIGNKRGIAISSNYAAMIYCLMGEFETAIENVNRGLEILEDIGDQRRYGELLRTRGVIAKNRGNLDLAEQKILDSIDIFDDLNDRKWRADSLIELGSVCIKKYDISRAEDLFNQAYDIKDQIRDRAGKAWALGGLGLVDEHRSEYAEATKRYRESGVIAQEINDVESRAYVLSRLGAVAKKRGKYEASKACLMKSKSLFSDMGNTRREARVDRQLGDTERATGNYKIAGDRYLRSLDAFERIEDRYGRARTLFGLGRNKLEQGELDHARRLFQESMSEFNAIGAPDKGRNLLMALDCNKALFKNLIEES